MIFYLILYWNSEDTHFYTLNYFNKIYKVYTSSGGYNWKRWVDSTDCKSIRKSGNKSVEISAKL